MAANITFTRNSLKRAFSLSLAVAFIGVLASLIPLVLSLEESVGLDRLFNLRGPREAPEDVMIIAIDQSSSEALNLPDDPSRWPRTVYADLIDKLSSTGASLIVLDVFFRNLRNPAEDQALANSIRNAGNVILLEFVNQDVNGEIYLSSPTDAIAQNAIAIAPFPLPVIPVSLSQFWTFKQLAIESIPYPTLPVMVLQARALPFLDQFLALIVELRPELSITLPQASAEPDAINFQKFATTIRELMLSDESLAEELQKLIINQDFPDPDQQSIELMLALTDVYSGSDSRYLNYFGPQRSITTRSVYQILQDEDDAAQTDSALDATEKVVFIGLSENTLFEQDDDFFSPFSEASGLNLSGVEIEATAYSNLLNRESVTPLPMPAHLLVVLGWGLLLGSVAYYSGPATNILLSVVLGGIYIWGAFSLFAFSKIWLPVVVPLGQIPLSWLGGYLSGYISERTEKESEIIEKEKILKEKERIESEFGRNLPPQIVSKLTQEGASEFVSVYSTCLHTDITGYTDRVEALGKIQTAEVMKEYHSLLKSEAEDHGGCIHDHTGDATMAVWISELMDQQNIRQNMNSACKAALTMLSRIQQFNQDARSHFNVVLPTRIGIHTGDAGLIVEEGIFRLYSDTLNSTQRIQEANKVLRTRILVSDDIASQLEGFLLRNLGTFRAKGKSRPIVLHELIDSLDKVDREKSNFVESFNNARESFLQRNWVRANARFMELLDNYGEDGVSQFYLGHCQAFLTDSQNDNWDGVFNLTEFSS